ncbi:MULTISPECIES: ThiF family adenylyltransferase [Metabacillus]|uniref:ThiF family adenylyltransferase n=1 Tax=Metabacillus TaxID=2675233 RepID=UPI000C80AA72|nr:MULTISPECIES: ThiF family adenylyltransferase [Metabacillus]MCM3443599.1 ThiF family adenylyltransferase [Metabacillus halosaccharovorans]PMC34241.1 thiamine biosynthesis protein ThiF [Bacillus sp. UMB0899]
MINLLENQKKLFPFIVQIGTGATGSNVVSHVAQLFSIFNISGQYVIVDPDIIESRNLLNQLFLENEVGKKKADVLARRYRAAYQVDIASYSKDYIEDVDSLKNLFNTDYLQIGYSYDTLYLPIIIGCVDNNYTRQVMHRFFESSSRCLLLDVGNESVQAPSHYPSRPKDQWTEEELNTFNNTGWSGQVVCGLKMNGQTILKPVAEMFPDILEDKDEIAPSQVACSNIIASEPQRLIVNKMAALAVTNYINELFESGVISNHMTFFHAKKGYMRSNAIQKN